MKYKCSENCGYTSTKFFGLCPKCKAGVGEEDNTPGGSSSGSSQSTGMFRPRENVKFDGVLDIKTVDKNAPKAQAKFKTKFKSLNDVLSTSGGFIESQVLLIGAFAGTGKSTLLAQISDKDTLYISSEESYTQINDRMLRVNPESGAKLLSTTSIDAVLEAIRTTDCNLIVIDSLNGIEYGVGWQTVARYAADITKLLKDLGKVGIIVSQVSGNGEIAGSQGTIHVVDTVLHMERSAVSDAIILSSSKNRFGEVGQVAMFQHTPNGLEEISIDAEEIEKEVGVTYTESRFGRKTMTISVEALVVNCQGSYGLKKANGFNFNMLQQIAGILSYNAKIDLNFKDVYVQIGRGLTTDDFNTQLAIANSILSSYYEKAIIEKAYGAIQLNGRVPHGYVVKDGQKIEIRHINDLISIYKRAI